MSVPTVARTMEQAHADLAGANLKAVWNAQRFYWLEHRTYAADWAALEAAGLLDTAMYAGSGRYHGGNRVRRREFVSWPAQRAPVAASGRAASRSTRRAPSAAPCRNQEQVMSSRPASSKLARRGSTFLEAQVALDRVGRRRQRTGAADGGQHTAGQMVERAAAGERNPLSGAPARGMGGTTRRRGRSRHQRTSRPRPAGRLDRRRRHGLYVD